MGYYTLTPNTITDVELLFHVKLNSDASSTADYVGHIRNVTLDNVKDAEFGTCKPNTEYTKEVWWSGLTSNKSYTFTGDLSVKWQGESNYVQGGATISSVTYTTRPARPVITSATLSNNNNTLNVSWTQDLGGKANPIRHKVVVASKNATETALATKWTDASLLSSESTTVDISGLSSGEYIVYIRSTNESISGYGNDLISSSKSFTIPLPEEDITGTISNVKVTPSKTSALVEWKFTPGSSFRSSSYSYDYEIVYGQIGDIHDIESSSSTSGTSMPKTYAVTIPNLTSGKTYRYSIKMIGRKNGGKDQILDATDAANTFTTTGVDVLGTPTISMTETTATISWDFTPGSSTTNWYCGFVEIGKGAVFRGVDEQTSAIKQGNSGKMTFSVTFTGLSSGQKYSYGLQMRSGTSNSSSAMYDMSGSEFFKTGNFTTSGTASGDGEYGGTLSNINVNPGDTYVEPSFKFTPTSAETHYYKARFYIPAKGANLTSVKTGSSSSPISFTMADFDRAFDGLTPGNTYSYSIIMYGGPDDDSLGVNNVRYDGTFTTSSGSSSGGGSSENEPGPANGNHDPNGPTGYADDYNNILGRGHLHVRGYRSTQMNTGDMDGVEVATSDGTALDSITVYAEVFWEGEPAYFGARIYYAKDNLVSNTHYLGYIDGDYYEVTDNPNIDNNEGGTVYEIDADWNLTTGRINNVKAEEVYYLKAYALSAPDITQNDEENASLNTNYYSNVMKVPRVTPYLVYTDAGGTGSVVNVTSPRANTIQVSYRVNKFNLFGLGDSFKFVLLKDKYYYHLSDAKSASDCTVLYEGSPHVLTNQSDIFTIDETINNAPGGSYSVYPCIYYYNVDSGWDLASRVNYGTQGAEPGQRGIMYVQKQITVSGPSQWDDTDPDPGTTTGVPTGLWSASPSAYQKTGTKKVNYSATVSRNDSVQSSYYVRIRVVDTGTGSDIGTTDPQYISRAGSISISRTTSSDLSNGSHSYQFVPEYSASQSGPWTELRSSSGGALKQIVTFVITDGGGGGSSMPSNRIPLWSWDKQNNEHATQQQVRQAYIAVSSQGAPEYFLHQVWNSLLYFVEDKIELFGKSWWGSSHGDKYLDFTNALMTNDDRVLTAKRFMTLTYNILNISASAGISFTKPYYSVERRPNETVYGAYFINATNAINDIIAQINANL